MNLLNKIFNGLFSMKGLLGILVIIILYLLLASTDTILQRFGFETKESVKVELVNTKVKLQLAEDEIAKLKRRLELEVEHCKIVNEVEDKYDNDNKEIDDIINGIIPKDPLPKPPTVEVPKDDTQVNIPTDKISLDVNIVNIHKAYDALFGS